MLLSLLLQQRAFEKLLLFLLFVFFQKKVRSIESAFCFLYLSLSFPARHFWRKEGAGRIYPLGAGKKKEVPFVLRRSMNRDDDDDDAMKK